MHEWISQLETFLKGTLPGASAHSKMSPVGRGNTEEHIQTLMSPARISAVMVLLFQVENIWKTVLIKRPDYQGVHSGQIGFPGGKYEEDDKSYQHTALRETEEEIGIPAQDIQLIGALSRIYIPPSNFIVYPFIGWLKDHPIFSIDPKEVESLLLPDIEILLDESIKDEGSFMAGGQSGWQIKAPYYKIEGQKVWGATAAILSEFKEIMHLIKA